MSRSGPDWRDLWDSISWFMVGIYFVWALIFTGVGVLVGSTMVCHG